MNRPRVLRRGPDDPPDHGPLLAEVRAALAAGAAPRTALLAGLERGPMAGGQLAELVHAIRLGQPLADAVPALTTSAPALDLLIRALAVSEGTGCGGLAAVEQALDAADDETQITQRLRARTAQARGTAAVLTVLPVLAWLLFVALDPALLRFYVTPFGMLSGALATGLALLGRYWAARLVSSGARAAGAADPLAPPPGHRPLGRAFSMTLPAMLIVSVGVGVPAGLAVAAAVLAVTARRPAAPSAQDAGAGGAAETVELVAVALASGLAPQAALAAVAPLAPPAGRIPLTEGARRMRGGEPAEAALAGGGLASLGAVLGASERWGAPAVPDLRRLAARLRDRRRAAAEEAAERTQLNLVFPTTLLTLPAFTVGVVPPLLWTALVHTGG